MLFLNVGKLMVHRLCRPGGASLYANGRFTSFSHPSVKVAVDTIPLELVQLEKSLLERPCGQYVLRMYEDLRKTKF
jgi:hypothetical protein